MMKERQSEIKRNWRTTVEKIPKEIQNAALRKTDYTGVCCSYMSITYSGIRKASMAFSASGVTTPHKKLEAITRQVRVKNPVPIAPGGFT